MSWRVRFARQGPLLAVLLVVTMGLIAIRMHYWRKGLVIVGGGVMGGAALRLLLPARRAGLLVVRGRTTDVAVLSTLGLGIVALAVAVPRVLP